MRGCYSDEDQRAFFRGLMVCGSVWGCPVCAVRISEGRRQEVAAALVEAERLGLRAVPVTRTIRHGRDDPLSDLLEGFGKARSASLAGRFRKEFFAEHEVAGVITAKEVTHGSNGWHVHTHEVWFVWVGADLARFEQGLSRSWGKQVLRAGLQAVTDRGLQVQKDGLTSAEYLTKFGRPRDEGRRGLSHELAKAVTKSGRSGGRTPRELLGDYLAGDKQAGALWVEYYRAFEGRMQLHWSNGLRRLFLPDAAGVTDEEIAGDVQTVARDVVKLLPEHWQAVQRVDARAAVLRAIEVGEEPGGEGALVTVGVLLRGLGCDAPLPPVSGAVEASGSILDRGPSSTTAATIAVARVSDPALSWPQVGLLPDRRTGLVQPAKPGRKRGGWSGKFCARCRKEVRGGQVKLVRVSDSQRDVLCPACYGERRSRKPVVS